MCIILENDGSNRNIIRRMIQTSFILCFSYQSKYDGQQRPTVESTE